VQVVAHDAVCAPPQCMAAAHSECQKNPFDMSVIVS